MSKENKKYTYTVKEGGWNTEWATSPQEAYKKACETWKNSSGLTPIKESFFIADLKTEKHLLNLFY